ncbi:MAG: right-handed parallel beta-helix repeat-containing protein [Clostridia bacterium]|nr:right-handed parallel beta-helix repeat-containing protein [Clostridia bacterium]
MKAQTIIRVIPGTEIDTISKAQALAREAHGAAVTVAPGVYREALHFDARDSGCTYHGEGAVLTGGLTVPYEETLPLPADAAARIAADAAPHIRVICLRDYGYTGNDWGELSAIGAYNTAGKYDGVENSVNAEVFSGGKRMICARYPNEGFLHIQNVLDQGEPWEFPSRNYFLDWRELRNPRGGTYIVDHDTNERIKTWREPQTAWIFGYFMHDWADASTPIAGYKTANRLIYPRYVAHYGCKPGAEYYFYNVLEELDAPGEFFLDRTAGVLYVYPYAEGDDIEISLSGQPAVTVDGAEHLTLTGFTVKCCRASGIVLRGNHCTLQELCVNNVAEHGITASGSHNRITGCEITRTGKGGILISGGDRVTLTPGENRVENCYIHHFSEVFRTYQPGVGLYGVGNVCTHNEICFTPHEAIEYGGNDLIIEYNNIHDAVRYSEDAGAIYAGKNWTYFGCVIRYNIIRDIGSEKLKPVGIYWDDGIAGQSAYGNLLINTPDHAFGIGGGHNHLVCGNVSIGSGSSAIFYDDRNRDGFVHHGSFRAATEHEDSIHWVRLREMPYKEGIWAEKYPALAALVTDFSRYDDPDFPCNPSHSLVENNIVIRDSADPNPDLNIAASVRRYSTVGAHPHFETPEEAGFDMERLCFVNPPAGLAFTDWSSVGRSTVRNGKKS